MRIKKLGQEAGSPVSLPPQARQCYRLGRSVNDVHNKQASRSEKIKALVFKSYLQFFFVSHPLTLMMILIKILTSQQEGTSGEIPVRTCQADSSQTAYCTLFPGKGKKKVETNKTQDILPQFFNVKYSEIMCDFFPT